MNDEALAALYGVCFPDAQQIWSADSFAQFRDDPFIHIFEDDQAALVARIIGDEAEILTVFVHPDDQGKGVGQKLLDALFQTSQDKGVTQIFLEVAEDNYAAICFYEKNGFAHLSKRENYYKRKNGVEVDALVLMRKC